MRKKYIGWVNFGGYIVKLSKRFLKKAEIIYYHVISKYYWLVKLRIILIYQFFKIILAIWIQ